MNMWQHLGLIAWGLAIIAAWINIIRLVYKEGRSRWWVVVGIIAILWGIIDAVGNLVYLLH